MHLVGCFIEYLKMYGTTNPKLLCDIHFTHGISLCLHSVVFHHSDIYCFVFKTFFLILKEIKLYWVEEYNLYITLILKCVRGTTVFVEKQ
jgi:hypothetical protein